MRRALSSSRALYARSLRAAGGAHRASDGVGNRPGGLLSERGDPRLPYGNSSIPMRSHALCQALTSDEALQDPGRDEGLRGEVSSEGQVRVCVDVVTLVRL